MLNSVLVYLSGWNILSGFYLSKALPPHSLSYFLGYVFAMCQIKNMEHAGEREKWDPVTTKETGAETFMTITRVVTEHVA